MSLGDLGWIDIFYTSAGKHLFMRKEDSVLIMPPNRVYKLNSTGAALLAHLARGKAIGTFPGIGIPGRAEETEDFFRDLKTLYTRPGTEVSSLPAVERIGYDYSFTRLPVLGEIAVTYRCNNRCRFCYVPAEESEQNTTAAKPARQPEMTTRQIRKIIRIFKEKAKIPFFSFTGGEPLLREDLESCIAYGVKLGLTVNLVSNGTLCTPERARSLKKTGLSSAQISLEAPEGDLHDRLTGRPGSFGEGLEGIRNLREAGIPVQTNTTLTAENGGVIRNMPKFLESLGIERFAVNLFIPAGAGKDHPELFIPYSETPPFIEALRREAARYGLTFYWYSPVPYCIYNPIAKGLGNKSCAAVDGLISVSPAGDVLPCSSYAEPLGNLLETGFESIWFSERGRHFKNKEFVPEPCTGCGQVVACQGACPLYWDYAGTEELIQREHCYAE